MYNSESTYRQIHLYLWHRLLGMDWGYVSPTPPSLTLCELFLLTRQLSSRPPTYKVVLSINTDYSTFQQLRESLY